VHSLYDRRTGVQDALLARRRPKVAIEAGVTDYWWKYVGHDGCVVGIDTFGESAPAPGAVQVLRIHGRARRRDRAQGSRRKPQRNHMAIKVGINGYGRIGRNILRALYESGAPTSRSSRSTTWATPRPTPT
jgi:hypothetical protein